MTSDDDDVAARLNPTMIASLVALALVFLIAIFVRKRRQGALALASSEDEPWAWETGVLIDDALEHLEPTGIDEAPVHSGHPGNFCSGLGSGDDAICVLDPWADPKWRPIDREAPLGATGPIAPVWPLLTTHSGYLITSYKSPQGQHGYSGRSFYAKRQSTDKKTGETVLRRHAGIDLFGRVGDIVVAPEDGKVFAILSFLRGTYAIYLLSTDGRRLLTLGEVENRSWREFGIAPGMAVVRGQELARVGAQSGGGAHMLHFQQADPSGMSEDELLAFLRASGLRWYRDKPPPLPLRDPSAYLIKAATTTYRRDTSVS